MEDLALNNEAPPIRHFLLDWADSVYEILMPSSGRISCFTPCFILPCRKDTTPALPTQGCTCEREGCCSWLPSGSTAGAVLARSDPRLPLPAAVLTWSTCSSCQIMAIMTGKKTFSLFKRFAMLSWKNGVDLWKIFSQLQSGWNDRLEVVHIFILKVTFPLANQEEFVLNPSKCYSLLPQNFMFDLYFYCYCHLKFQSKKLPQARVKINFLWKHQNWLFAQSLHQLRKYIKTTELLTGTNLCF